MYFCSLLDILGSSKSTSYSRCITKVFDSPCPHAMDMLPPSPTPDDPVSKNAPHYVLVAFKPKPGCHLPLLTFLSYAVKSLSCWSALLTVRYSPKNSTCLFSFHLCCHFSTSGSLYLTECSTGRITSAFKEAIQACEMENRLKRDNTGRSSCSSASLGFRKSGSIDGISVGQMRSPAAQNNRPGHSLLLLFPPVPWRSHSSWIRTCVLHLFTSFLSPGVLSFLLPTAASAGSNWHVHFLSGVKVPPGLVFFFLNLQFSSSYPDSLEV